MTEQPKEQPALYVECGSCEMYHPAEFFGDCRDDENRFDMEALDKKHGALGWSIAYDDDAETTNDKAFAAMLAALNDVNAELSDMVDSGAPWPSRTIIKGILDDVRQAITLADEATEAALAEATESHS